MSCCSRAMRGSLTTLTVVLLFFTVGTRFTLAEEPTIKVLIVDGQNNHDWNATTPVLADALASTQRFEVDVATSPSQGADMSDFRPDFSRYDVIVSNYNGDAWSEETRKAFANFVRRGGGFVCVHAADNAFPEWKAYNDMIGLGGWGGRSEKSGPYVFVNDDGQTVRDTSPGPGGSHGPQREFEIIVRDADHPITKGMPRVWMHAKDELYDRLRGPAANLHVLATAHSSADQNGRDAHEPMVMTIEYGDGRVFHTTLGHAPYSMKCVGFMTLLQRGTEWAATGKVTLLIPADFPTARQSRSR